jgi:N-acetylglucosaminyl-diphospho-decaprenol L-rhamnosyltransferase
VSVAQSGPDLSVVIVSWNTRDLTLRCLRSLHAEVNRSEIAVETILVDNASSDRTVESVADEFPDVMTLPQPENLGFAAANNIGLSHSRGKAVLILNPDTEIQPGSLTRLWKTLHASSHVGLVAPVLLNTDGSFQSAGFRFPGLVQTMLDLYPLHPRLVGSSLNGRFGPGDGQTPFRIDHPLGACMLVRRNVIDEVGDFDTGYFIYSEEIDWCRRIAGAGWTTLCAPGARVTHHGGQSTSQVRDRMRRQLHQSRARYLRRYHSARFIWLLQVLMAAGIWMKRAGVPLPSGGLTVDELVEIACIYQSSEREPAYE